MPDKPFGITFSSHWGRDGQVRRDSAIATQIGADWDRWPLPWEVAEPDADGHFEWESGVGDDNVDFDNGLNQDRNAGLKVIGVLNGPFPIAYYTPDGQHAIEGLELDPFLPNGAINPENRWAHYVWAVTTNEQIASKVDTWEIINEFNLVPQGVPYEEYAPWAHPETYHRALDVACQVLGQTSSDKPILLGGPEDIQALRAAKEETGFYWNVLAYAKQYLPNCIDGISLHTFGNPRWSPYLIEKREDLWPGKPMWFTETGLQHATDIFPFTENKDEDDDIEGCGTQWPCGTEGHQASYIIQHTLLTWQALLVANVGGKVFHHTFIDGPHGDNSAEIWGLLDANGNELPAKRAAEFVFDLLQEAEFWSPRSGKDADDNPYEWIVFETSDGRVVNVLWAIGDNVATVEFKSHSGNPVEEYDQEGNLVGQRDSAFTIELPTTDHGATGSETAPEEPFPGEPMLGGLPVIFIESPGGSPPTPIPTPSPETGACIDWWVTEGGGDPGFDCGTLLIRNSLANAGVTLTDDDPPVPGILFSTVPYPPSPDVAWQLLNVPATYSDTHLSASLVVSHTVLSGTLQAEWTTDAWVGAQFTTLSVPQAQVYDEDNVLVAEGAVQARPAAESAVALAMGNVLTYTTRGDGFASFYAPATDGLGIGGTWQTYTAQVQSHDLYGVGLEGATVTVNGQEFTGQLVLFTSSPVTLQGHGHTLTPNFAGRAHIQAQDAKLLVGPASGTAVVGPTALDASRGLGLSGYTGPLTITQETADTDRVELHGPAVHVLSLSLDPSASQTTAGVPTAFAAQVESNAGGLYALVVEPYQDWHAAVGAQGTISVTPPLGTPPGDYTIRVGAVSVPEYPLLAAAMHVVTVLPHQGMELSVAPDPLTTVPMGPLDPDAEPGNVNNGQAQVPGAAYVATVTNTSSTGHTFNVQVIPDGFPVEWIKLGGAGRSPTTTLTLPAGSTGNLGVYVSPLDLDVLPAASTEYPFTVHATAADDPSLTQSDSETFVMPSISFAHVSVQPDLVYASPGFTTTFEASVRNVGNVSGAFDFDVTLPITTWVISNIQSPSPSPRVRPPSRPSNSPPPPANWAATTASRWAPGAIHTNPPPT